MAVYFDISTGTGKTMKAVLQRLSDSKYWDTTGTNYWQTSPTNPLNTITEGSGNYDGNYTGSLSSAGIGSPGLCRIYYVDNTTGTTIGSEIVNVIGGNTVMSNPVTDAKQSGFTNVYYVRTDGASTNDGKSPENAFALPSQACAVATSGDLILLGAGTFSQGTTQVSVPAGVTMRGVGMAASIISSTRTNTGIVTGGNGACIEDLKIYGSYANDASVQIQVTYQPTNSTTTTLRRVWQQSVMDAVYFASTSSATVYMYDCRIDSVVDTVVFSSATSCLLECHNCDFVSSGTINQTAHPGGTGGGIVFSFSSTCNARFVNCRIRSVDSDYGATAIAIPAGTISLINCTIEVHGSSTEASYTAITNTSGTVYMSACNCDPDQISGTITKIPTQVGLAYDHTFSALVTAGSFSSALSAGLTLASSGLDRVLVESSISASSNLINDAGTQLTSINARQGLALAAAAGGAKLAVTSATSLVEIYPVAKPSASPRLSGGTDSTGNRTNVVTRVPT